MSDQAKNKTSSQPLMRYLLTAVFGLLLFTGLAMLVATPSVSQQDRNTTYGQLALFGNVFQHIRDNYVEEVNDKNLIESAITGMLTSLDPHSDFLVAEDFDKMQERTRGEFGGLGIEITMEEGLIKVVSPIDDTPAARAGVISGDLIIGIDGENVLGLSLSESVELMRGRVGSEVTITIRRGDRQPFDVTLARDVIKIRSVRHDNYDDVGYVRITTFSEQTTPGLRAAIDELRAAHGDNLAGIVLDLRNNPGGLLSEAISVTDLFLEAGEIVSTRGRNAGSDARYFASKGDITGGLPLVVLINSGSASASEIVAGALKDHKRALIMGMRSFGKGSVQSVIPMGDIGAVRLTTARYYTPSGISIQAHGINPDIEVELAVVEDIEAGEFREEDLRGSLAGSENEQAGESETADADAIIRDYQLARAIDLLRGLRIFKRTGKQLANG